MGYSSNRYATVDRQTMGQESRTSSLTAARLEELQQAGGGASYGPYPAHPPINRRTSQSPGNPLGPPGAHIGAHPGNYPGAHTGAYPAHPASHPGSHTVGTPLGPQRNGGRPSPPNGHMSVSNGFTPPQTTNGRPSPPVKQPVPHHPPGHGNMVAAHQVEQRVGVSSLHPPGKIPQVRSLTGSASASAESGDSSGCSGLVDSENSAHSSQGSLGPQARVSVR